MLLDFEIKKAIAATAHLLELRNGSDDIFFLIKKLYYADRIALIGWGKTITGDSLVSMDSGPVVSTIYDLMKGKGKEENLILWKDVICKGKGHSFFLRKQADKDVLSQRELTALESSHQTIGSIRGKVSDWLHRNCPEWKNPNGSSIPIDPSQILRLAKKTEGQIKETEQANEEIRFLNRLLSTS